MSQPPGEKPHVSTERADQLGQRIGIFAHQVQQRVQDAAAAVKSKADSMGMEAPSQLSARKASQEKASRAKTSRAKTGREQPGAPTMERAEATVDSLGQQLGVWGSQASLQIQKVIARVREDTEDMWVEAQTIRKQIRQPR